MNSQLPFMIVFSLTLTLGCRSKDSMQSGQDGLATPVRTSNELSIPSQKSGCSAADRKFITTYSSAAVQALVQGNLERSTALAQELERKLSPRCLVELAELQPMRTKCSTQEKKLVLSGYEEVIEATLSADIARIFDRLEELEASISEECWIAVNYPQEAGVRQACSSSELTTIASAATPSRKAFKAAMVTGDLSQIYQVLQLLSAALSQDCQTALTQAQAKAQAIQNKRYPTYGSARPAMPDIIQDHGNGTYVMPGVGACTNTDCMAF